MADDQQKQLTMAKATNLINEGDFDGLLELLTASPWLASVAESGSLIGDAIWADQYNCLRLLVERGFDVNWRSSSGLTLLMIATILDDERIPLLLMEYGADVTLVCDRIPSILCIAVHHQPAHLAVIRELINRGANPATPNFVGLTPLQLAKDKQLVEIVEILETALASNNKGE